jgi:2,3-diaminopropionate biosynthesis protein SbnB
MLYLNEKTIHTIGIDWKVASDTIFKATEALNDKKYSQPVKPYLRYKNPKNRIIAMPAYLGGNFEIAGIKWISSFPDNLEKNIKRAHSVIILNNEETGEPLSVINTPIVSGIRTAAVTGAMIVKYLEVNPPECPLQFGIIGFGPIGQLHLSMLHELFGEKIDKVRIFDLKPVDLNNISQQYRYKVSVAKSWQEVYHISNVFITCTVSASPYIDKEPPAGSLQLNISLRDYLPEIMNHVDKIVVDDWEEICRENTDIENMHKKMGLKKEDTINISEALIGDGLNGFEKSQVLMFNPMGMAIFDIAIGKLYYNKAKETGAGVELDD